MKTDEFEKKYRKKPNGNHYWESNSLTGSTTVLIECDFPKLKQRLKELHPELEFELVDYVKLNQF